METKNLLLCRECGEPIGDEHLFCCKCGARVERDDDTRVCENCGAEILDGARFCFKCGAELKNFLSAQNNRKKSNSSFVKSLVKRSVALLVSIVMLVFAFLPIVSFSMTQGKREYSFRLSALDGVELFIDSTKSIASKDIEDSDLYQEWKEVIAELADYDLSDEDDFRDAAPLVEKSAYLSIRIGLQLEDSTVKSRHVFTLVLCILYMLAAAAFFVFALLDFILFMCKKEKKWLSELSASFLPVPALLSVVSYVALRNYIDIRNASMSITEILTLALAGIAIVYFICDRVFISGRAKISVGEIVKRSLALIAATMLIISVTLPVMGLRVTAHFNRSDSKSTATCDYYSPFFGKYELGEKYIEEYENKTHKTAIEEMQSGYNIIGYNSKSFFKKGEMDFNSSMMLDNSLLSFGGLDLAWMYAAIPFVAIIIALIAAFVMWINLYAVITGKALHKGITVPIKILGVIAALALLACMIVVLLVSNHNLDKIDYPKGCGSDAVLGAGPVMAVIFAIAACCIPMAKKKDKSPKVEYYNW